MKRILSLVSLVSFFAICAFCSNKGEGDDDNTVLAADTTWSFNSLDGWDYAQQDDNPAIQYDLSDGILKIYTRASSWDRKKLFTKRSDFTTGRYTWRTYIPQMGTGDQASVGSWIYCDDHHEIDFEVGYGKGTVRETLGAADNQMVAYMTTQDYPFQSVKSLVDVGWHIFEIDITMKQGKYYITWYIDSNVVSTVQQTFGDEYSFHIFCSVENLTFIGDHQPLQENYGLYDYVTYKYHE
jgi:hypothetical protein